MNRDIVSFCSVNQIVMLRDEYQLEFNTITAPNVKGFFMGYQNEKFAVTLGPEIPEIYLIGVEFIVKHSDDVAKRCK